MKLSPQMAEIRVVKEEPIFCPKSTKYAQMKKIGFIMLGQRGLDCKFHDSWTFCGCVKR